MFWDGISTIIKDGLELKSPNYVYKIDKLLNDGASIVYKASRNDGKQIFLKQFRDPTENQDAAVWKQFISFHHSVLKTLIQLPTNIVETNYEYFEFMGVHFHAKALENGKDLNKMIFEDKPNFATRFHIVKIALGILNAVHKKGIVHSDLKPQQFFIVNDNSIPIGFRVKLIDFDHCMIPALNLNRPAGTAEWKSPEHIKNNNIGFHSDVFSMGQIVYILLTGGRHPYGKSIEDNTYDEDVFNKNGYVSLNILFKGKLSSEISDIVDKMLEPDYSKRPTIDEVHRVILNAEKQFLKPKNITLESNGKTRLIITTETITREIVKSSFGNYNQIYNKQFEIMKDNNGEWFVKGYDVPPTAKDAAGNIYNFHKTKYNGLDVTNKYTKIENGGIITVGNEDFKVSITDE